MQKEDESPYPNGQEELLPQNNDGNLGEVVDPLYDIVELNTEIGPTPGTEHVIFQPVSRLPLFQELTSSKRTDKRLAVWERRDRIIGLIEKGLTIEEISEALEVKAYNIIRAKKIFEDVTNSKLNLPRQERNSGDTKKRFIAKMEEFERDHPGEKFKLTDWSGELGVTRERLRQIYNALNTKRTLPPRRTYFLGYDKPEIDRNVKELLNQGLAKEEIGSRLALNANALNSCLARLASEGEITRPPTLREKQIAERRKKIQELINEGLSHEDIIDMLQIGRGALGGDIIQLQKKGEVPRKRKLRRKAQDLLQLDSQVKRLRDEDLYLSNARLATLLNVPEPDIHASIMRLRRNSNGSSKENRNIQRMRIRRQAISELFQERRYTMQELKEKFRKSESVLRVDLTKLGLKPLKLESTPKKRKTRQNS